MSNYLILIIVFFIIILITVIFSKYLKLYDISDNKRKIHTEPALFTGGVGIFVCSLASLKIENYDIFISKIIAFSVILCITGLLDDLKKINIGSKLALQIFTLLLIIVDGLEIKSLGFFLFGEVKLGFFAVPFTLGCMILLINAVNYIDGVDGLASTIFINSFILLIFYNSKILINDMLLSHLTLCLIVFLLFNFKLFKFVPKCFLGNSGSLLLGYFLGFMLIYYSQTKNLINPLLVIWPISFVVFEFISVNLSRFLRNTPLTKPGNDHIHFYILFKTKLKFKNLFFINFINFALGIIGYYNLKYFGPEINIFTYIIFFSVYFFLREKKSIKNSLSNNNF